MLSPAAIELLANDKLIWNTDLRLFMRLLVMYDLRNYVAISYADIARAFKLKQQEVAHAMVRIIAAGLLEQGGPVNSKYILYRVRPVFLLSPDELEEFYQERQRVTERLQSFSLPCG